MVYVKKGVGEAIKKDKHMSIEHRVEFKPSPSLPWSRTEPLDHLYADQLVGLFHAQGWAARVEITRIDKELR